ncbi:hypothetical protein ACQP1O_29145 [Nocardia sp. CA-151230]|uniref:hypothetical protein n=1 Tax=Nocardia sp. CA-151230 TaxID=3239982 RepID=UPI003D8E8699
MKHLLALDLKARAMHAISLDGGEVRILITGLDAYPDGVAVDQARGHVYWTSMGAPDMRPTPGTEPVFFHRTGMLERADLDGGNRTVIVPPGAFTTGKQLTADFDIGRLYWCDREGMQVLTCDLAGGELHPLVVTGKGPEDAVQSRNWPVGICLDLDRRLLYWTQKGAPKAGEGRIFRAPLELPAGTSPAARTDIEVLWHDLPEPIDLELSGDGNLLWTDRGAEPAGNTLNRASVDPVPGPVTILSSGYREAIGVVAISESRFYVSDLGGAIRLVDLDDGIDTEIARPGGALTGLALADL